MEEKNEHLKQRVKELEINNHRTITKEEMKEMIKEGLTPITNILIGKDKETVNAETQVEDVYNIITSISLYKQTQQQHPSWISSILELSDGKIALGCGGGAISLNQMNYETKEWTVLTKKTKRMMVLLLLFVR